ncbi:MAG TPA: YqhA family protein [Caulobacteraceae bacterium]
MSKPRLVGLLESALFAARWLLAPFYVGLIVGLLALLGVFGGELGDGVVHLLETDSARRPEAGILLALSLIDLSLAANLVIIVILSGYESFVSRIDAAPAENRPSWMGTVDFSGLKMKLIASIVAISAIALLRSYLELGDHEPDPAKLIWQSAIPLVFVVIGVLLAAMDWIVSSTKGHVED